MSDAINLPFNAFLLIDRWSLNAYERGHEMPCPEDIQRHLFTLKHERNRLKPDYCLDSELQEELKSLENNPADSLQAYLVQTLRFLARRYLLFSCGRLYVKKDLTDEWMELVRVFPPLMIEAAFFTTDNGTSGKVKDKSFFEETMVPIFRDSALRRPYYRNLEKIVRDEGGLSDLHIHLNGTSETDVVWWSQLGNVDRWIASYRKAWRNNDIRRQHEQFSDSSLKDYVNRIRKAKELFKEIVAGINECDNADGLFSTVSEYLHPEGSGYPALAKGAYFYLKLLTLMQRNELDGETVHKFHWMILILGDIHQMMVQQWFQKGFSQFQMVTKNELRSLQEGKQFRARLGQLSMDNDLGLVKYMEGRFSPALKPEDNIALVRNINKGYGLLKEEMERQGFPAPALRLIAHFIKKEEKVDTGWARHRRLRAEVRQKAWSLWRLNRYLVERSLKPIVGIDAAANEMHAGPEVFAPAFHWLRKTWSNKGKSELHVTYHAGEDFIHLLSGLRMMVEAVDFLRMEQGDRIGHGTAAGIDPRLWLKRIGNTVNIPAGEWLDDLLMVYDTISDKGNPYSDLNLLLPKLHNEIEDLHCEIYGSCDNIMDMITAWKYRKYDPDAYLCKKTRFDTPEDVLVSRDMEQHRNATDLYRKYHYDPDVKKRYCKIKQINICNDIFTAESLEHIQNLVLHKVAMKGIAIEVLLTSNLAISFYRNPEEHHLKRWLADKSDGNLTMPPLVIGTDDPGIFMTNIYIEYSRIAMYLESHGYGFNERLRVLRNLIQAGNLYNFDY